VSEQPPALMDPDSVTAAAGCKSVAWVFVVAGLLMGGVVYWRVSQWGGPAAKPIAQKLTDVQVPKETLVRGALPGSIPRLMVVRTLTPSEADKTKIRRGKFLVKGDLVIGVVQGEEAVAYPLRFLVWHEAVEHSQGGVPLVVCYGPWDGGAGVFDRRPLRPDGTQLEAPLHMVPSGVVSNSAQLIADEPDELMTETKGSLWSSLQARAVAGPAAKAGYTLRRIPSVVLRWEDWRALHPNTKVLGHDEERLKLYGRAPYKTYMGSDTLQFPVDPLPPAGLPRKAAVLAVRIGSDWRVYPVDALVERAEAGQGEVRFGERKLRFKAWRNDEKPAAAYFLDPVDEVVRAYWFAWYAARPEARTLGEGLAN
jgi:uncharacterized protein DUF3179